MPHFSVVSNASMTIYGLYEQYGQLLRNDSFVLETPSDANYALYPHTLTQEMTVGNKAYWTGEVPGTAPDGQYWLYAVEQAGGSPSRVNDTIREAQLIATFVNGVPVDTASAIQAVEDTEAAIIAHGDGPGEWDGSGVSSLVITDLPNIRVAPRFTRCVSRRADGTGTVTEPFRLYPGEEPYLAVDMAPLYGDTYVATVGTVAISRPDMLANTLVLGTDIMHLRGLGTKAIFKVTTAPAAGETHVVTAKVTMNEGADEIFIRFRLEVMDLVVV